ncbi:E2/UBC family protein [Janthinobacterium lividum]|uniref:E2/UBC family protein n=1 Tax=Janthinobacterium lividum TaxID=29581 RepID=UPI0004509D6D|nr:E2/UBC family protein [Janthinobacterium lividum]EZP34907.1 hypothetical protein BW37_05453 [Janthinobacterium lividum]
MTSLNIPVNLDHLNTVPEHNVSSTEESLAHNAWRTVLVADESLDFKEIQVEATHPTGGQILIASVGSIFSDAVLLQLLPTGELEGIRLQESPTLEVSNKFLVVRSDRSYYFTIDGVKLEWPHRLISGYAIRTLGRIGVERDIVLTRSADKLEIVTDSDFVDLDLPGTEVLNTKLRSWKLRVQAVTMDYTEYSVKVSDAMKRAGFDPTKAWHIFLIVEGQPKKEVTIDTIIDLRTPGIEKIRLMQRNVDNGDGLSAEAVRGFELLDSDTAYLDRLGLQWETILAEDRRWLLIYGYPLGERYVPALVSLALDIPKDYPAAQIDMFYFAPAVSRMDGHPILSTQVRATIKGAEFQGWSRHRNSSSAWDAAVDNVATHLALVDSCLDREFGE